MLGAPGGGGRARLASWRRGLGEGRRGTGPERAPGLGEGTPEAPGGLAWGRQRRRGAGGEVPGGAGEVGQLAIGLGRGARGGGSAGGPVRDIYIQV